MKIGGNDKVKSFMNQIEGLLPKSIDDVYEKWDSDSCPALKLKIACDTDLEFDIPKSMGGLKTTGLELLSSSYIRGYLNTTALSSQ